MEEDLLDAIAQAIAAKATFVPPDFYYLTLANNGTEVSGITRKPFLMDDPVAVSATVRLLKNATDVTIDNTPAGTADEAWVMTAASGGERWFRDPFDSPITLTSGGSKTFLAGDLTQTITNTTPAAP